MARVLVVDDEEKVRAAVRALLEGAGHEVAETDGGGSARPCNNPPGGRDAKTPGRG